MFEIEIKARVSSPDKIRGILERYFAEGEPVDKSDHYWSVPIGSTFIPAPGFRLRIRQEPGSSHVTFKEKSYSKGIEVNKEIEFSIDDTQAFTRLLEKMGASPIYSKRKKGWMWKGSEGLVIELVDVEGLGTFLEVEILREESDTPDLDAIKRRLVEVLKICGLGQREVESRPYSQLLGIARY